MHEYRKHWMKHTAMVPKGFIRFQVLESLSKKAMSGSEIINEIEARTNGRWKPSPGSVYPLLSWMQDNGHIKELPSDQSGMKRYELTDKGKVLLEQQKKIMEEHERTIDKEKDYWRFSKAGMFFLHAAPWLHLPPEKTEEMHESMRSLVKTFFKLGRNLEDSFSEQALNDVRKVLDETTQKLEKINENLRSSSR